MAALPMGHEYLVRKAQGDYEEVFIAVGSAWKGRTRENPLTLEERRSLIKSCHPRVTVFSVEDRDDDLGWVNSIEERLEGLGVKEPSEEVTFVGMNGWTKECFEGAGWRTGDYEPLEPDCFSGETVRKRAREGEDWKDLVPECALKRLQELNFEEIAAKS